MLHGWGSSSKVWHSCISELAKNSCLWCIDLPGHGNSHAISWNFSVDQGIELLAESLPEECTMLGWSLGGLWSQLYATKFPQRISKLMLISSVPRFLANNNWPNGMQNKVFMQFVDGFEKDPETTLKRFCALQVLNSASAKQTFGVLLQALSSDKKHIKNIAWGLSWLRNVDLRANKTLGSMPIYLMHGENDQLVSTKAAQQTVSQWQNAKLDVIPKAGHAPFIAYPETFIERVKTWLKTNND